MQLKNTVALALLEGFNKWVKTGLKIFATHEVRNFKMDQLQDTMPVMEKVTEHNISIGGQLIKSLGKTFHYNAQAELWTVGEDAGIFARIFAELAALRGHPLEKLHHVLLDAALVITNPQHST